MISRHLLLAIRILLKNKLTSSINIIGFAVGISAFLLIINHVYYKFSYDGFHKHADNIYRLTYLYAQEGKEEETAMTNAMIAPALKGDLAEVVDYVRLYPTKAAIGFENRIFNESRVFLADPSFFKVFSYPMVKAATNRLLEEPNTVVITESMAKKYFGSVDPLNKTLYINKQIPLRVDGIIEDAPLNSHLHFDFLVSFKTWNAYKGSDVESMWGFITFYSYIQMEEGSGTEGVRRLLPQIVKKYNRSGNESFNLQPLKGIHLYSNVLDEVEPNGSIENVWIFISVAMVILIIAWLNYINLTTAQAINREKEVGIKKLLNAPRTSLIVSFLLEVFLNVFIAVLLSVILLLCISPVFTYFTGLHIEPKLFLEFRFILIIIGILVFTTLFAGLYPAFILSSFKAISAARGMMSRSKDSTALRNSFVVFQFMTSGVVIVLTLMVNRQLAFLENQRMGIEIDNIVGIKIPSDEQYSPARIETLKSRLLSTAGINEVTTSNFIPGQEIDVESGIRVINTDPKKGKTIRIYNVDDSFLQTYRLRLLEGRNFLRDTVRKTVILNVAAVRLLGIKDATAAIGQKIVLGPEQAEIVGVVDNFSQKSLKHSFDPIILNYSLAAPQYYSVRFTTPVEDDGAFRKTLARIDGIFRESFPLSPFDYMVVEDYYNSYYREDRNNRNILSLFSVLTAFVSMFGLFGLASYSASKRTKEFAIRKVLGGGQLSILLHFLKSSLKLVVLSQVLSLPIAYYLTKKWLSNYAFQVDISVVYFLIPSLFIILISSLTLAFHVLRATRVNPTTVLSRG